MCSEKKKQTRTNKKKCKKHGGWAAGGFWVMAALSPTDFELSNHHRLAFPLFHNLTYAPLSMSANSYSSMFLWVLTHKVQIVLKNTLKQMMNLEGLL